MEPQSVAESRSTLPGLPGSAAPGRCRAPAAGRGSGLGSGSALPCLQGSGGAVALFCRSAPLSHDV